MRLPGSTCAKGSSAGGSPKRAARIAFLPVLSCLFCVACKPSEEPKLKVIIGAVLITGTGGPPVSDSVVVIAGSRIRGAGSRPTVPIPAGAEKVNGAGKFLMPGIIDVYGQEREPSRYLALGVTSVRGMDGSRKVSARAKYLILPEGLKPAEVETILEEARKQNVPVTAEVRTQVDVRFLVDNGVAGFVHMIRDTEVIDPALLERLRNLQLVFAPVLARAGPDSQRAMRNTRRLAAAGVPIAVGAGGLETHRELELLTQAGLSPADVIVAATRNGALAMRKLDELGTIEAGKRADLLLVSANPAEDVRNARKIERIMRDGQWVDRAGLNQR